jgi:outer membrane protein assembly factor BamB
MDLHTGRIRWRRELKTLPGSYVSAPTAVSGRLIVSTMDGSLRALARDSGAPLWQWGGRALVAGRPTYVRDQKHVVVIHAKGMAYAINPITGQEVRATTLPSVVTGATLVRDNVLYFGAEDGSLQAFDLKMRECMWKLRLGREVSGPMVPSGYVLYAPLDGTHVVAVSIETGKRLWRFGKDEERITPPAVDGAFAFVVRRRGELLALDAETGAVSWRASTDGPVTEAPTVSNGRVYVGTRDGKLSAFRADDGKLLWKCHVAGAVTSPPLALGNRVLVATLDGTIEAYAR